MLTKPTLVGLYLTGTMTQSTFAAGMLQPTGCPDPDPRRNSATKKAAPVGAALVAVVMKMDELQKFIDAFYFKHGHAAPGAITGTF